MSDNGGYDSSGYDGSSSDSGSESSDVSTSLDTYESSSPEDMLADSDFNMETELYEGNTEGEESENINLMQHETSEELYEETSDGYEDLYESDDVTEIGDSEESVADESGENTELNSQDDSDGEAANPGDGSENNGFDTSNEDEVDPADDNASGEDEGSTEAEEAEEGSKENAEAEENETEEPDKTDEAENTEEKELNLKNPELTDEEREAIKAEICEKSDYSSEVNDHISSVEELEVYQKAGLKEEVVDGRTCLIRSDLDFDYYDPVEGKTNREIIAERGSPYDAKTGEKIQIHHVGQDYDAPFAELTATEHKSKQNYKIMHPDPDAESWRRDSKKSNHYNGMQRPNHWMARAKGE